MGFYEYRSLSKLEQQLLVEYRRQLGYPEHSPPHLKLEDCDYLISAACFNHTELMKSESRKLELQWSLLTEFSEEGACKIRAWVILDNHYHALIHANNFDDISKRAKSIHGRLSRKWNLEDGKQGRKTWYYFNDRNLRSIRHLFTTLNYIHYNPVKHKYVDKISQWPFNSFWEFLHRFGKNWMEQVWREFPIKDYGIKWDKNVEMDEDKKGS